VVGVFEAGGSRLPRRGGRTWRFWRRRSPGSTPTRLRTSRAAPGIPRSRRCGRGCPNALPRRRRWSSSDWSPCWAMRTPTSSRGGAGLLRPPVPHRALSVRGRAVHPAGRPGTPRTGWGAGAPHRAGAGGLGAGAGHSAGSPRERVVGQGVGASVADHARSTYGPGPHRRRRADDPGAGARRRPGDGGAPRDGSSSRRRRWRSPSSRSTPGRIPPPPTPMTAWERRSWRRAGGRNPSPPTAGPWRSSRGSRPRCRRWPAWDCRRRGRRGAGGRGA